jgi:hypothetical protein
MWRVVGRLTPVLSLPPDANTQHTKWLILQVRKEAAAALRWRHGACKSPERVAIAINRMEQHVRGWTRERKGKVKEEVEVPAMTKPDR